MKKIIKLRNFLVWLLVMCLVVLQCRLDAIANTTSLIVPKDKVILVEVLENLDSSVNKAGDKVLFETRENVIINGVVVIPYGTRGAGSLEEVHRAGHWGKGGYFKINFGSIKTINGIDIPVEIGKSAQGAQEASGVILPVVGALIFLPLILFGFAKGKEAKIAAGTQLYVNSRNEVDLGITAEEAISTFNAKVDDKTIKDTVVQQPSTGTPEIKKEPFVINSSLICRGISEKGDPEGVNVVFPKDCTNLSIWFSFANLSSNTLLESKWYNNSKLFKTKQIFLEIEKKGCSACGTIFSSFPLPAGEWRVDLVLNEQVLKSVSFKIE